MYEIDFLPVESDDGPSSKSGDAILVRCSVAGWSRPAVVVIDGGFQASGAAVVEHIRKYYQTDSVDLVISTHPDTDHLNGLSTVIEELSVGELLIHNPRLHLGAAADDFSNIEAIEDLVGKAQERDVAVTEPFAGISRFDGQLQILGPTEGFYKELAEAHLDEVRSGVAAARMKPQIGLLAKARDLLQRTLDRLPIETLSDDVETGPRNNSSVISLIHMDGRAFLFTGDAGIPALTNAADEYEVLYGSFASRPLNWFQAPHHGSRRNLGPTILNRLFGELGSPHGTFEGAISSALADKKHPSPRVTNALMRRGASVLATEGRKLWWYSPDAPGRSNYGPAAPLGPLAEDEDD